MGRKKNKKGGNDFYDNLEEDDIFAELAAEAGVDFGDNKDAAQNDAKKSKKNQAAADEADAADGDDQPAPVEVKLLTKKQKARLKKEKEEAAKKEASRKRREQFERAEAEKNGAKKNNQNNAKNNNNNNNKNNNNKNNSKDKEAAPAPQTKDAQKAPAKSNNNNDGNKNNNNNNNNNSNNGNNNKNNNKNNNNKKPKLSKKEQQRLATARARLAKNKAAPAKKQGVIYSSKKKADTQATKESIEAAELEKQLASKKAADAARLALEEEASAKVDAKFAEQLAELDDVGLESSDDETALGVAGDDAPDAAAADAAAASDDDSVPDDWDASSDEEEEEEEPQDKEAIAAEKAAEKAARRAKRLRKRQLLETIEREKRAAISAALTALKEENTVDEDDEVDENALRSPICCVLGHVDTGKTKLLDRIRRTNVQGGEAGGITQQIGATFFPAETLVKQTEALTSNSKKEININVPGLLVIDTPGHESFTNLRTRGSSLCDIAILVVDLMHGLEPQTKESIKLLRSKKTPFVIALNKVDRCVDWKATQGCPIRKTLKKQSRVTTLDFESRVQNIIAEFAAEEINTALYWKNTNIRTFVSMVPTSAITGEGVPDILLLMIQLMQKMMSDSLKVRTGLNCTILEVKVIEGFGTTIDVVLVDGVLHEGDTIVVCGMKGPISTNVRALLTPHPGKELRVKGAYQHHKRIRGAMGIKIAANGLEGAVAGSQLFVAHSEEEVEELEAEVMQDMGSILERVDKSGRGVCVQASTLGSLEALLEFLRVSKIPVSGIQIGPVHRKDVMRASIMLEQQPEYACILAFDVKVTDEAKKEALSQGVTIFTAEIIYHLFDQFTAYMKKIVDDRRTASLDSVVWPCVLQILEDNVFMKKDPIVVGCEVKEGTLRLQTPIAVPSAKGSFGSGKGITLGRVVSIQRDYKDVESAETGDQVAVKIQPQTIEQSSYMYGRHFDHTNLLMSKISRASIDVLKQHFADQVTQTDKRLIQKMKPIFGIQR